MTASCDYDEKVTKLLPSLFNIKQSNSPRPYPGSESVGSLQSLSMLDVA